MEISKGMKFLHFGLHLLPDIVWEGINRSLTSIFPSCHLPQKDKRRLILIFKTLFIFLGVTSSVPGFSKYATIQHQIFLTWIGFWLFCTPALISKNPYQTKNKKFSKDFPESKKPNKKSLSTKAKWKVFHPAVYSTFSY